MSAESNEPLKLSEIDLANGLTTEQHVKDSIGFRAYHRLAHSPTMELLANRCSYHCA
jgi:hypothetical protein